MELRTIGLNIVLSSITATVMTFGSFAAAATRSWRALRPGFQCWRSPAPCRAPGGRARRAAVGGLVALTQTPEHHHCSHGAAAPLGRITAFKACAMTR